MKSELTIYHLWIKDSMLSDASMQNVSFEATLTVQNMTLIYVTLKEMNVFAHIISNQISLKNTDNVFCD